MGEREESVVEVTEVPTFKIVDDRLHVCITSGAQHRCYSISFHKARNAMALAGAALDKHQQGKVIRLPGPRRKGMPLPHG